jgi:predicted regulator of Ras-like GTPase activity (Roadblock/LC7/MglB family)
VAETKKEMLDNLLTKLTQAGDVEGAAVITRDGLMIASSLPAGINSDTLAAMAATMQGAAETAVQELKKSSPDRVIVESRNTKLITIGAGEQAILACMTRPEAKLGLVLIEMKKAVEGIKKEVR